MADSHWAAEEVAVGRAAPDAATQRAQLQFGLNLTSAACEELAGGCGLLVKMATDFSEIIMGSAW